MSTDQSEKKEKSLQWALTIGNCVERGVKYLEKDDVIEGTLKGLEWPRRMTKQILS